MATIQKQWASIAWVEGASDAWTTLSSTTEEYSSSIDLSDGDEGAHIVVEVNFDTTPTDNVIASVYGSLDGTAWDDIPLFTLEVPNTQDPAQFSFIVTGVAYCRIGFKQTGSTNTHDVRASVRTWKWESV